MLETFEVIAQAVLVLGVLYLILVGIEAMAVGALVLAEKFVEFWRG